MVSIYTGVRQACARDKRWHGLLHNTSLLYAHARVFFYSRKQLENDQSDGNVHVYFLLRIRCGLPLSYIQVVHLPAGFLD